MAALSGSGSEKYNKDNSGVDVSSSSADYQYIDTASTNPKMTKTVRTVALTILALGGVTAIVAMAFGGLMLAGTFFPGAGWAVVSTFGGAFPTSIAILSSSFIAASVLTIAFFLLREKTKTSEHERGLTDDLGDWNEENEEENRTTGAANDSKFFSSSSEDEASLKGASSEDETSSSSSSSEDETSLKGASSDEASEKKASLTQTLTTKKDIQEQTAPPVPSRKGLRKSAYTQTDGSNLNQRSSDSTKTIPSNLDTNPLLSPGLHAVNANTPPLPSQTGLLLLARP